MSKNQTCLVCPLYFQGLGRPCLLFVLFTWSSVPSEGGMQYTTYSVLKYKRSFTLPEYFPLKCRMLGNQDHLYKKWSPLPTQTNVAMPPSVLGQVKQPAALCNISLFILLLNLEF